MALNEKTMRKVRLSFKVFLSTISFTIPLMMKRKVAASFLFY